MNKDTDRLQYDNDAANEYLRGIKLTINLIKDYIKKFCTVTT